MEYKKYHHLPWCENLHHVDVVKPPVAVLSRACLPPKCAIICSSHIKHEPSKTSYKGLCFLIYRHIAAGKCVVRNKLSIRDIRLSPPITSLASHKLGWRNASQILRAKCVVGGCELVVRYGPSVVGRMVTSIMGGCQECASESLKQ